MEAEQYIKALERELKKLPKEEREDAVSYYREYIEEACQIGEGIAGNSESQTKNKKAYDPEEEFGQPKELAAQIIQESAGKALKEPPKSAKKGMSTVWVVILAILASPIALPVGIALIAVMAVLVLAAAVLAGSLFIAGAAAVLAGILGIVAGIIIMFSSAATGILTLGFCVFCVGIGGLLAVAAYHLGKAMIAGIVRLFGKKLKKSKEGKEIE